MKNLPESLTVKEAAFEARVSRRTLYRWNPVKIGREISATWLRYRIANRKGFRKKFRKCHTFAVG